jgi:tetratricopeptide (TPR) repeat protein
LIDADIVLERLSGLPLALTQAGSYMQESNVSALTYAKRYDSTWKGLMQGEGRFPLEEYGDRDVLTTWILSYEQVQKQSEKAVWLLKLWGFLDHGEVWYDLVAAASRLSKDINIPMQLLSVADDEQAYAEAIDLLSRFSLVDGREGSDSHSMHSVLHRWCGQLVEDREQHVLGCIAASIVASNMPSESEPEFWKGQNRLLGHAIRVSGWLTQVQFSGKNSGSGIIQAGTYHSLGYLLQDEDRSKAENMYQRALQGYEKACGPEHTSTLSTVNNLGSLYKVLGQLSKAEKMYQRALYGREKAWGPEHTLTLDSVNNLGNLYADLGRLNEAEEMYQRALQGYEKACGPEHTSTLSIVNNLGSLYKVLGQLSKAEKMYQRALNGREKAWGLEHTSTLDIVNNLGLLYAGLGQLDKAEKMYQRALQGYERAWGPEHTSTLDTVNNLGNLYADLGRLDEAEEMHQRALQGYEKAIKPEDLSTYIPGLNNIWSFASLYERKNQLDDARAWYSKALSGYENVVGTNHPKCQTLRIRLAIVNNKVKGAKLVSERHKLLRGFRPKQT